MYTVATLPIIKFDNEWLEEQFGGPVQLIFGGFKGPTWEIYYNNFLLDKWHTVGIFENKNDAVLFQLSWPS